MTEAKNLSKSQIFLEYLLFSQDFKKWLNQEVLKVGLLFGLAV